MQLRIHSSLRAVVGGSAVFALCAGAFAWGLHSGPEDHAGRDLYGAHPSTPLRSVAEVPGRKVTLTATGSSAGMLSADAQDPNLSDVSSTDDTSEDSPAATFQDIYVLLKRNYVEGVPDDSKLAHGTAAAMVASLQDPYSRFFEPSQFAELMSEAKGQFDGIGAVTAVRTLIVPKTGDDPTRDKDHPDSVSYQLVVVNPLPGSPAEKAGLRTGDIITDIDGQWLDTYDLISANAKEIKAVQKLDDPVALTKMVDALQKQLDGSLTLADAEVKLNEPGAKPLALTVTRPGETAPVTLSVQPAPTTVSLASGKSLPGGIGYIKVTEFTPDTGAAFNDALSGLGTGLKGMVLDLRGATGDSLEAGADVTSRLSTQTVLGYQQMKDKTTPITLTPRKALTGPVTVLTDVGTSGVAELCAAALQLDGAKLIGTATFGNAAEVRPVALRDGSGFTMTVGELLTASKASYSGTGVKPDVVVPSRPGADDVLDRAVSGLSSQVARLP